MRPYPTFTIFVLVFALMFSTGCAAARPVPEGPKADIVAAAPKGSTLEKITFREEEKRTRILIEGTGSMADPFYRLLTDPTRILIDIPKADLRQIKDPLTIQNGTVNEVVATQYDDKGRIEIGLQSPTRYTILKEDRLLVVDIEKTVSAAEEKAEAKEEKREEVKEAVKEEPKAEIQATVPEIKETQVLPVEKAEPSSKEPAALENPPAASVAATVPAPEVRRVLQKAKQIVDVSLEEKKNSVTFSIIGDGTIESYNSFKMESPARLVVDILGVGTRMAKKSIRTQNGQIKEVRLGSHPDKLRLVFDAVKSPFPPYQIDRVEDRLVLSLGEGGAPAEPQVSLNVAKTTAAVETKEAAAPPAKSTKAAKDATVTGIDFNQVDHRSRIVITVSEEPEFESQLLSKNVIAVDIKKAQAPKQLLRPLNTKDFESTVGYVDIKNIKGRLTNDVRVLVNLKEEVPYQVTKEGKSIYVDVEEPKRPEKRADVAPAVPVQAKAQPESAPVTESAPKKPEGEGMKAEEKPVIQPPAAPKSEEEKKAAEEALPVPAGKVYSGRRLSLDFKDADVKNILRLIAEVSNLNIITGEDVTGKVTMRLVDVPWDQALDVILQARSLGMNRVGNVVRIAPVDKLKKEVEDELSAKRAKEKLEDLVTELVPVNYAAAKEVIPQVKSVLSDRGDVKVDERTNILIIKDIPRNMAGVRTLLKSLDTKTPQVLIEARIVEANLNFQRELGVAWGFVAGGGKATLGGGIPSTTLGTSTNDVVNLPAVARSGVPGSIGTSGVIEFLFSRGTIQQLDVAISAHENNGDTKIISSPKIATLDNKEASIEQGLRIPYLKLTTEGTVTTDFIDANIKLTVTPHVTSDGNVRLNIKVKKDAPDTTIVVQGVPSIDKKEAITEVLVRDDGVVVIAGIYQIDKSSGTEGIPLFSKIPLLGWLFKREAKQDNRRDLLIFISPKIMKEQV